MSHEVAGRQPRLTSERQWSAAGALHTTHINSLLAAWSNGVHLPAGSIYVNFNTVVSRWGWDLNASRMSE